MKILINQCFFIEKNTNLNVKVKISKSVEMTILRGKGQNFSFLQKVHLSRKIVYLGPRDP